MLEKNGYPYEYMDIGQRLNETSFTEINVYSNPTMGNIIYYDYKHEKRSAKISNYNI